MGVAMKCDLLPPPMSLRKRSLSIIVYFFVLKVVVVKVHVYVKTVVFFGETFFPLAVGESVTYRHIYNDFPYRMYTSYVVCTQYKFRNSRERESAPVRL